MVRFHVPRDHCPPNESPMIDWETTSSLLISHATVRHVFRSECIVACHAGLVFGSGLGGEATTTVKAAAPLLLVGASFWIIGFVVAYMLAFTFNLGAIGVWIGLSLGLAVYAILLVWRFHRLTTPSGAR